MKDKYKILIVEDQALTAMEIQQISLQLGLNVTGIAKSYSIAIDKFRQNIPDIVIMDIRLEGEIDGISTVKELYTISDTKVIYLTAYNDDATIDKAIATNPAAYEIKPFNKASLQSTIKIVISKLNNEISQNTPSNYDLGYGYSFNMKRKELFFENTFIKIGDQEADLLYMLIDAKGQIITNKQIEYEIWGDNMISESSVRTLVWRLRTRLEHKIIETVPYHGIRLKIK
jgi:DNA-binding response OmpR family regulator